MGALQACLWLPLTVVRHPALDLTSFWSGLWMVDLHMRLHLPLSKETLHWTLPPSDQGSGCVIFIWDFISLLVRKPCIGPNLLLVWTPDGISLCETSSPSWWGSPESRPGTATSSAVPHAVHSYEVHRAPGATTTKITPNFVGNFWRIIKVWSSYL